MTTNEMTIRELNALIETHYDAVAVVSEGIEGLSDAEIRAEARIMIQDHQDAIRWLQGRVHELGGEEAEGGHTADVLRQSWQKLWKGGGDREILLALRANERVAVDGLQAQLAKENRVATMSEEGVREHMKTLDMELRHFRVLTDRLRLLGASVDNDDVMGAVRNAAEHLYAAASLAGDGVESFIKWATGTKSSS